MGFINPLGLQALLPLLLEKYLTALAVMPMNPVLQQAVFGAHTAAAILVSHLHTIIQLLRLKVATLAFSESLEEAVVVAGVMADMDLDQASPADPLVVVESLVERWKKM
jgi:hypothetical protein